MKLLHVSDPHFGTERPEVLTGLLALAQRLQPDVVVLSGDITQRATAAQFAAGRRFADALTQRPGSLMRVPLFAIPGNHDLPLVDVLLRLVRPYARYQATFGPALEQTWDAPWLQLTTLDSTRRWRHKNGQLSQAQIERVAGRLRQAKPEQLRLVVAHHPLAVERPQDRENLLRGHQAALRCWAEAGADVVMGGHIHLPFVVAAHQQNPALAAPLWVVQAGTAVSSRVRHEADNSVNVLHVGSTVQADEAGTNTADAADANEADANGADANGTAVDAADADAPRPEARPPVAHAQRAARPASQRHCRVDRWDWQPGAGAFACVRTHALACGAPA